jgi:hypothetical protein
MDYFFSLNLAPNVIYQILGDRSFFDHSPKLTSSQVLHFKNTLPCTRFNTFYSQRIKE